MLKQKLSERLNSKTQKSADHDCWLWVGGKISTGYGTISVNNIPVLTHRAALIATGRKIPKNKCVLHRCDVRACVKPSHLWIGTHKNNMQDCLAKGRAVSIPQPGTSNPAAKLSNKKVLEIRESLEILDALAKRYGVHRTTIWQIRTRKIWKHL